MGPAALQGERHGLFGARPGEAAGLARMASSAARHRAVPLEVPVKNHALVIEAPEGRESKTWLVLRVRRPGLSGDRLTSMCRVGLTTARRYGVWSGDRDAQRQPRWTNGRSDGDKQSALVSRWPDDRVVTVIRWHICPTSRQLCRRETGASALSRDGPSSPTVASLLAGVQPIQVLVSRNSFCYPRNRSRHGSEGPQLTDARGAACRARPVALVIRVATDPSRATVLRGRPVSQPIYHRRDS